MTDHSDRESDEPVVTLTPLTPPRVFRCDLTLTVGRGLDHVALLSCKACGFTGMFALEEGLTKLGEIKIPPIHLCPDLSEEERAQLALNHPHIEAEWLTATCPETPIPSGEPKAMSMIQKVKALTEDWGTPAKNMLPMVAIGLLSPEDQKSLAQNLLHNPSLVEGYREGVGVDISHFVDALRQTRST
jgi:hypothetical protein